MSQVIRVLSKKSERLDDFVALPPLPVDFMPAFPGGAESQAASGRTGTGVQRHSLDPILACVELTLSPEISGQHGGSRKTVSDSKPVLFARNREW